MGECKRPVRLERRSRALLLRSDVSANPTGRCRADCEDYRFFQTLCNEWVNHCNRSQRGRHVRYTSNSDRTLASQRNDAMCQEQIYAVRQTARQFRIADQGRPAYLYQFDWQSPAGFESCHCLEIPFVLNNFASWTDSPMLKGAKPAETKRLAEAMHGAWIAFARTGKPDHPPPYGREDRMTMRFDSTIRPVSDLAGLAWRKPWPL